MVFHLQHAQEHTDIGNTTLTVCCIFHLLRGSETG